MIEADSWELTMRGAWRLIGLIVLCLAVPAAPFVIAGPAIERAISDWLAGSSSRTAIATAVVAILAVDIVLPVPSSFVSTFAGAKLGPLSASTASWLGMTLGAGLAFGLARWFGRPFAARLAAVGDVDRTLDLTERFGAWLLVLTRGVPILAEASVLALGVSQLPWSKFLPALVLSNLGIALVYSVFGHLAREENATGLALAASIALPAAAAIVARTWLRRGVSHSSNHPERAAES
ncbi:MAG: VTT domain-containing protein [Pirellulales bacterium]|nr:VTT domain-containing protein [Pirellulales bacterium]